MSSPGKTHLAKALGVAACRSFSVEYLHCDALFCGLADTKRRSIPKFEKRMRRLAKLDLLILDDFLIVSTAGKSESGIIFQILERLSEKGKSTIVCSQRNPGGWSEMLPGDEAIADAIIKRTTRHYTILVSKKYEWRAGNQSAPRGHRSPQRWPFFPQNAYSEFWAILYY